MVDVQPVRVAMESALMLYPYALDHLAFRGPLRCMYGERQVWLFHERCGSMGVRESEQYSFIRFEMSGSSLAPALLEQFL